MTLDATFTETSTEINAGFGVLPTEINAGFGVLSVVDTGGGDKPWIASISLLASAWVGEDGLYSQVVAIDGITVYSKVDLLPSVEQLAIFHNKDVAFVTENEDGVVTVYAIGDKPLLDYTMQAQITEVEA